MAGEPDQDRACVANKKMGPRPEVAVAVLTDLGLSDRRISQYFGICLAQIAAIRQHNSSPGQETERGTLS